MDADELLARDGEHAERVGFAQIVLAGKGETLQVADRGDVARLDVGQALAVERHSLLDIGDQRAQPFGLERLQLFARHRFQLRLEDHQHILCPPATPVGWSWFTRTRRNGASGRPGRTFGPTTGKPNGHTMVAWDSMH